VIDLPASLAELHNTQFVFGIALGNLQLGGIGADLWVRNSEEKKDW
jgi:hypothetical protein